MLLWKWVYKYLSEAVLILLGIYSEVWYWSHDSSIFNFLRNCYTVSWTSLVAQLKRICLPCWKLGFNPWTGQIPWRRAWQPTSVFLPRESHGQRRLMGYRSWGCNRHNWLTLSLLCSWATVEIKIYTFWRRNI